MRGGYYSAAGDAETTVSTLWGDLMYGEIYKEIKYGDL
jgi:hypothetical protein